LTLSANAGDPATTFQLARIDVDDVQVSLNDGTTEMRSGVYKVELVTTANGKETLFTTCAVNAATKTGLTVPPGTYRITTTFPTHANSSPNVQTIAVP
jgi:hypothetical protein